jgi:uroporphyrinogen decarboxylase
MDKMTTHERMLRTFQHKETDRVPIHDAPWGGTIRRWQQEGMPANMDWRDYFGVDKIEGIFVDVSPKYESKILEKTDRYTISTTPWGVTLKNFNEEDSTPEFIDYTVVTEEKWQEAKKRMIPSHDRVDWNFLKENYPKWRNDNRWIQGIFWFGYDVTHTCMVGMETLLIALSENPEWVQDMFNTLLDMSIAQFDMMWDAGYKFDTIFWPDDMGYKNTPFFSTSMYRELLKPVHKRAVEWAHNKGIYAHLHSCGDIMPLIPDVVETGIDALNPIEIKAGMDIVELKNKYGKRLVLHGGINAVLWDKHDEILAEIDRYIPFLYKDGGYIFASDHSIPNSVCARNFKDIVDRVKVLTTK